jgi:hypothetical protein
MPGSENEINAMTDGGNEELRSELQSLRTLISAALVLLIVFSVCLDLYLSMRVRDEKAGANQIAMAAQNYGIGAGELWSRLVEYSKTHPDFHPIIDKWKSHITVNTNNPPPRAK